MFLKFKITAFSIAILAISSAHAYDSKFQSRMRLPSRSRTTAPWQMGSDEWGYVRVDVSQSSRAASSDGTEEWLAFPGLYVCSSDARLPDGGVDLDLCRPAGQADIPGEAPEALQIEQPDVVDVVGELDVPGWLTARLAWDDGEHSEHRVIAKYAADAAGLTNNTSIFGTFFTKYPARNKVIGTELGDGRFLVGQSWEPVKHDAATAYVTRGVSLLDLAQLADFSHSLEDWANGNEECPIPDVEGAFTGTFNRSCHEFAKVMGSLNATHFNPLNQKVYKYYHQLAIARMQECRDLANRLPLLNEEEQALTPSYSFAGTEVQWCEKEAMAYEMHAQHFLQDAWSTGHMWKRWGTTELRDFPFKLPGENAEEIPARNIPARRGAIALSTALFSGMIHGTKGVMVNQVPFLEDSGLLEDALCSPEYPSYSFVTLGTQTVVQTEMKRVRFISPELEPEDGAGDLYFSSHIINGGSAYWAQQDRLVSCAAASMRQVYLAGPQSHGSLEGAPAGYNGIEFSSVNPFGEECFGQWVTNESMHGAWGSNSWWYAGSVGPGASIAANPFKWGVWRLSAQTTLEIVDSAFPSTDEVLTEDKEQFFEQLRSQFDLDGLEALAVFRANEEAAQDGVTSAQLLRNGGGELTFLGVSPNFSSFDEASSGKPTSYADEHFVGGDLGSLQRVFARGRVKELCDETGGDSTPLLSLRERCIDGSQLIGGEVAACTSCVEVASLHLPIASGSSTALLESRCEKVGGASLRNAVGPQTLQWWYDSRARSVEDQTHWQLVAGDQPWDPAYSAPHPAEVVARLWCTGTENDSSDLLNIDERSQRFVEWESTSDSEECEWFTGPFTNEWGTARWRYSEFDAETPELFPDVVNVEMSMITVPNPHNDRCSNIHTLTSSNYDDLLLYDMPFLGDGWADQPLDAHLLASWPSAQLAAPACGQVVREASWNISCFDAALRYPDLYFDNRGYWGEPAVPSTLAYSTGCQVIEPVTRSTCPDWEEGMYCDASGRCQGAPALELE